MSEPDVDGKSHLIPAAPPVQGPGTHQPLAEDLWPAVKEEEPFAIPDLNRSFKFWSSYLLCVDRSYRVCVCCSECFNLRPHTLADGATTFVVFLWF
jgi:hypothetical protein